MAHTFGVAKPPRAAPLPARNGGRTRRRPLLYLPRLWRPEGLARVPDEKKEEATLPPFPSPG